jgi:hypothetical protein
MNHEAISRLITEQIDSPVSVKLFFFAYLNRIEIVKANKTPSSKIMVWKEKIGKLGYYKDFPLLWRTFMTSLKLSLSQDNSIISLANLKQRKNGEEKEKIVRYVNLCLHLRRRMGFKDSCLTSSLLLCHLLRQNGINAHINFSAKKDTERMEGHCWVSVGEEKIVSDYTLIFKYP